MNGVKAFSDANFMSVVAPSKDAIINCDLNGRVLSCNDRVFEIFGFRGEELLGSVITSLIPDYSGSVDKKKLLGLSNQTYLRLMDGVQVWGVKKSGARVPLQLGVSVWKTDQVYIQSLVARDVSDLKHLQNQIEERNDLFEALITSQNLLGVGVIICDAESCKPFYVNEHLAKMTGYTREEIFRLGSFSKLFPPEQAEMIRRRRERAHKMNELGGFFETVMSHKDGQDIYVELSHNKFESSFGPSFIVSIKDVTQKKHAQDSIRHLEQVNNTLIESGKEIVLTCNAEGRVTAVRICREAPRVFAITSWVGKELSEIGLGGEREDENNGNGTGAAAAAKLQLENGEDCRFNFASHPITEMGRLTGHTIILKPF